MFEVDFGGSTGSTGLEWSEDRTRSRRLNCRECPDGTVKIVYNDESQDSRYSNVRICLEYHSRKLVMNSETN
ncbi:hypothetical protein DMENIID0001_038940 [Sergentomyia squamirostris]